MSSEEQDEKGRRPSEPPKKDKAPPPAGPHADPALTNPDLTPGTGSLPSVHTDGDSDPGAG